MMPHAMDAVAAQAVRRELRDLLTGSFAPAPGSRAATNEEAGPFWSGVSFDDVSLNGVIIDVAFRLLSDPGSSYRFRVDLNLASESWRRWTGGEVSAACADAFAGDVAWFIVCFIGVSDLGHPDGSNEPFIVNRGGKVFEPL